MIVKGDLNGDGKITVEDLMVFSLYIKGKIELTETQLIAADIDGDGVVSKDESIYSNNDFNLLLGHLIGGHIIDEVVE